VVRWTTCVALSPLRNATHVARTVLDFFSRVESSEARRGARKKIRAVREPNVASSHDVRLRVRSRHDVVCESTEVTRAERVKRETLRSVAPTCPDESKLPEGCGGSLRGADRSRRSERAKRAPRGLDEVAARVPQDGPRPSRANETRFRTEWTEATRRHRIASGIEQTDTLKISKRGDSSRTRHQQSGAQASTQRRRSKWSKSSNHFEPELGRVFKVLRDDAR